MQPNRVLIFGDSYSTFKGYIPDGYGTYYSEDGSPDNDVTEVSQTWWHQVISKTGSTLVRNDSWTGSTICHTGYGGADCSQKNSFIYRLRTLREQGFFEKNPIDTVFIFGGTNDFWAEAPVSTVKYENWQEQDLYSFLPALCYFLDSLRTLLPNACIYCLINTVFPPELAGQMCKACEKYDVTQIVFDHIEKGSGHPTVKGMQEITDQVLKVLRGTDL